VWKTAVSTAAWRSPLYRLWTDHGDSMVLLRLATEGVLLEGSRRYGNEEVVTGGYEDIRTDMRSIWDGYEERPRTGESLARLDVRRCVTSLQASVSGQGVEYWNIQLPFQRLIRNEGRNMCGDLRPQPSQQPTPAAAKSQPTSNPPNCHVPPARPSPGRLRYYAAPLPTAFLPQGLHPAAVPPIKAMHTS